MDFDDLSVYDPSVRLGRIGIPTPTQSEKSSPPGHKRRVQLMMDDNRDNYMSGDISGFNGFGANFCDNRGSTGFGANLDDNGIMWNATDSLGYTPGYMSGYVSNGFNGNLSVPDPFSEPWVRLNIVISRLLCISYRLIESCFIENIQYFYLYSSLW